MWIFPAAIMSVCSARAAIAATRQRLDTRSLAGWFRARRILRSFIVLVDREEGRSSLTVTPPKSSSRGSIRAAGGVS